MTLIIARPTDISPILNGGLSALLPLEVLVETLNIIGKKQGKLAALAASKVLLERESAGDIGFAYIDVQTLWRAMDLQSAAHAGPSFIDCLVMAHADQCQTAYVFGFDSAFKKNGYQLPV